jgi:hypothetical protein
MATKANIVTRDEGSHCIVIKEAIQEDIMNVNIYALNMTAPNFLRQTVLK